MDESDAINEIVQPFIENKLKFFPVDPSRSSTDDFCSLIDTVVSISSEDEYRYTWVGEKLPKEFKKPAELKEILMGSDGKYFCQAITKEGKVVWFVRKFGDNENVSILSSSKRFYNSAMFYIHTAVKPTKKWFDIFNNEYEIMFLKEGKLHTIKLGPSCFVEEKDETDKAKSASTLKKVKRDNGPKHPELYELIPDNDRDDIKINGNVEYIIHTTTDNFPNGNNIDNKNENENENKDKHEKEISALKMLSLSYNFTKKIVEKDSISYEEIITLMEESDDKNEFIQEYLWYFVYCLGPHLKTFMNIIQKKEVKSSFTNALEKIRNKKRKP